MEIPGFAVQLCFQHFVQEMDFTMSSVRKPTQREISDALELSESEVALYVAEVEEKADGLGHWIFFSVSTPNDILFWLRVGNNLTLETDAINLLWTKQSRVSLVRSPGLRASLATFSAAPGPRLRN